MLYLIVISGGTEISTDGPFETDSARDECARAHESDDPEVICFKAKTEGKLDVASFTNYDVEEGVEEGEQTRANVSQSSPRASCEQLGHEADPTSLTNNPADGLLVDVGCKHCGTTGSVQINPADLQW